MLESLVEARAREMLCRTVSQEKRPVPAGAWSIDVGLEDVTETIYPPFTKVDREPDYARTRDVIQKRYGKVTTF
jgi:hypothetical protein